MEPLVSIVVTTKNEENHIGNCLMSIEEQTYPHIEAIVVDNDSADNTKEIARKYTELVFDKGPERSAQRNYGMIDVAKGKYVMFIDADMMLSPCLVEACVKELEKGNSVALFISEIVIGTSYWCKVRRFERSFYDATVIDSARIYRRDIFCQVGGFDEQIDFGEEWDIDKEVKTIGSISLLNSIVCEETPWDWKLEPLLWKLGIAKPAKQNVIYHNEEEFNVKKYIKKKGNYAKKFDRYIDKWGKDDPDLKKQFGLWYRYFGVFLAKDQWRKVISHPLLTVGMYLLRFCVGLEFLKRNLNLSMWPALRRKSGLKGGISH
ncbi:MAG: glycosyltransferase [Desulfobacterales bacterium]|nr:glycosyltransferase [Desulfobacterales bacterium]